ncbi:MAG TPA: ATP-binding protein [Candidatus Cloacimonadota bacterium]|nr:ATP-binding protein [Candidatus Cloacimonadota bacterium]
MEEKARAFFAETPKPEIMQNFEIRERDFVSAGVASAQIKYALKRLGVPSEILRRTAIAAYEAEINVTAHSKGGSVTSNIYSDCVYLIFKDCGPGMEDIEQSMTPGYSTADEMVREMGFGAGLGLPNIKKNSDVLHIVSERGKNTVLEIIIYY